MKTKEITINGVNYPVVFDLLALSNFEEITDKGFFEANLNKINNRMAIVMAAVLSADKDTKLTIEEMRGKESFDDYKQIIEAYNVVMLLANDFFKIPEVEKGKDPKQEDQEENAKKLNTVHELFQTLVGEIGIDRKVFYKELKWWEVKAIIRGYNARQHPGWEQTRWIAYHVRYCMGLPKGEVAPVLTEWVKFPWEKKAAEIVPKEVQDQLQAEMAAMNAELAKQHKE